MYVVYLFGESLATIYFIVQDVNVPVKIAGFRCCSLGAKREGTNAVFC